MNITPETRLVELGFIVCTQLDRLGLDCHSCSWPNLVERFFAQITTKRIRRGSFSSVKELEEEIRDYLRVHIKYPKPCKWTDSAEAIIEKVARCRETYETPH